MRSEDPLAGRLASGDPGAPEELVERYHAELYRYARALLRDTPAAEDAVQDAFERAFVALGRYSLERIESLALRPWLYRITLNVVRNAWRDGRREVPVAATPERIERRIGTAAGSAEVRMDALAALDRLPERQRVAVMLRYMEDLPYPGSPEQPVGPRTPARLWYAGASNGWARCCRTNRMERRQLDE